MDYIAAIGVQICIYVILVLSANLTTGMTGFFSLCQAALYGVGAYIGAKLLIQFNLPFLLIVLSVVLGTGCVSLLVSYASVKLKGDYFILATLGIQMVICGIFYNWIPVTRGPFGLNEVPKITLFRLVKLDNDIAFFVFVLVVTVFIVWFYARLQKSPFGRALKAIRSDELSTQSLGRNTNKIKTWAFFISAVFTGIAGVFYASNSGSVYPSSFPLDESIFIITALFVGGVGTRVWGSIAGAVLMIMLPQLFLLFGLPDAYAANLRQVIIGLVLIVLMFFKPQGLFGDAK